MEGASKSAYFLNSLLQAANVNSTIINAQTTPKATQRLVEFQDDYDILHLHWFPNDIEDYRVLEQVNKPIVWTLRDFSAFTGHCHFPADCERYVDICQMCPQLRTGILKDKSYLLFSFKQKFLENRVINFVAPSNFALNKAVKSRLLNKYQIPVIPNSINFEIFRPQASKSVKEKIVLGFCAGNILEYNKGFTSFKYVINKLPKVLSTDLIEKLRFHIIGDWSGKTSPLSGIDQALYSPYVKNEDELAEIFNQIDIMLVPSLQETFSRVTLEAQACGVPVVTFKDNGADEIIEDGITGLIATLADLDDLVEKTKRAVEALITQGFDKELIATRAREKFSNQNYLNGYLELYNNIVFSK